MKLALILSENSVVSFKELTETQPTTLYTKHNKNK